MRLIFAIIWTLLIPLAHSQVKDVVSGSYTPGFFSTQNFIKNPNCFANTKFISVSATGTITRNTTTPLATPADCQVAGVSSADKVTFTGRVFDTALKGQNCEFRFVYAGDASKWKAYAAVSGTAVSQYLQLVSTIDVSSVTQSKTASVMFPCGSAASAVDLVFEATAGTPGNFKTTGIQVGLATSISNTQQVETQSSYRYNSGTVVTATVTGAETRTFGTGLFTYVSGTGTYTFLKDVNVTATMSGNFASGTAIYLYIKRNGSIEAQSTQVSGGRTTSASYAEKFSAGDTLSFATNDGVNDIRMNVVATSIVNTQIFTSSCGSKCEDVFSAYVSSAGAISEETGGDWINGSGVVSDTSLYTFTFTSGVFSVAPHCWTSNTNGTTGYQAEIANVTTSSNFYTRTSQSTSKAASAHYVFCKKQGADFTQNRTVTGSLNEMVSVPGVVRPVIFSAQVSSTGVLSNKKGASIITSASCSAGGWTVNFSGLTAAPNCQVAIVGSANFMFAPVGVVTSSSTLTYLTSNNSTTYICTNATVFNCQGDM
jgi:hypothetical protein